LKNRYGKEHSSHHDAFLTNIFTIMLLSSVQLSKNSCKGIQLKVKLREPKIMRKTDGQGTAHTQNQIVKKFPL